MPVDINNTNVEIDFVPMWDSARRITHREEEEEKSEEEVAGNFKGVGHSLAGANESRRRRERRDWSTLGGNELFATNTKNDN